MPRIQIQPRRTPRQARSQATVETLLAAATRVLSRESLAGFTTNRVAEVAGVSVGSLYQYFPNKSALVAALIDRDHAALAHSLEVIVAARSGGSLDETLHDIARVLIDQQYDDPIYAAAIDEEERRLPLDSRSLLAERRFEAVAEALVARHAGELSEALPARAAKDLLAIARTIVEADMATARTAPPDLEARIVRALRGYLTLA